MCIRWGERACAGLTFVAAFAAGANAAAITVTDAKVQAGNLLVTGNASAANQAVMLDSRFSVRSDAFKAFSFAIPDYLPADCTVRLTVGSSALIGRCDAAVRLCLIDPRPAETAVGIVANCAPMGASRQGGSVEIGPAVGNATPIEEPS